MENEGLKNKKKGIIILVAILVIIAIICTVTIIIKNNSSKSNSSSSKVETLYNDLKQEKSYSFITTLNDDNKMIYEKNDNEAYIDTFYNKNESKYVVKDGNSYLIVDNQKTYYKYVNNDTELNKIELQLSDVINSGEHQNGEEEIDGKKYSYEEYNYLTDFTMQDTSNITQNQNVKTRFYFKNNKLVYIKTIIDDKQELLKVDVSNKVDSNVFDIPSDYEEK